LLPSQIPPPKTPVDFSDSDIANCKDTMRSVTGFAHVIHGMAVHWGNRNQKTVSKSSSHAEYVVASVATEETCIFLNVMQEIGVDLHPVPPRIDSTTADGWLHSRVGQAKLKY
jgi:hypothetical protein